MNRILITSANDPDWRRWGWRLDDGRIQIDDTEETYTPRPHVPEPAPKDVPLAVYRQVDGVLVEES